MISLETSFTEMSTLVRSCSVRHGMLEKGWPLSSNVEFKAKIEAISFALSNEEDMTSGPFIIMGTAALFPFIIWLMIFQNSRDPICFFSILAWTACV